MIKYKYVDALRGWAIIAVLLLHSGQTIIHKLPSTIQYIVNNGAMGVQLFYVVSAFTLFLSLNKKSKVDNESSVNFYIRRFFRIAPMYYIGIIYYALQDGSVKNHWSGLTMEVDTLTILSNFLFIHGFSPYWINNVVPGGWSIATEILFYCLVPSLFLYIKNLNQSISFFLLTLFINLALSTLIKRVIGVNYDVFWQDYLYFFFPNQLPVFACGIILYFLIYSPPEEMKIKTGLLFVLSMSILFSLVTGVGLFPSHILFAVGFIVLGYTLSKNQYILLVNPITIYFGRISYSMYLVHFAVIHWMTKFHLTNPLPPDQNINFMLNFGFVFICLIGLTLIISTFFYHLIEVPFQRIGKIVQRNRDLDKKLPVR